MTKLAPLDSSSSWPLALVYTRADAARLLFQRPRCRAVIAMTPNARAALAMSPWPIIVSSDILDDRAHLRIVARTRRVDRDCQQIFKSAPSIPQAAKLTMLSDLHYMAASALALWILIGRHGPWLIPSPQGKWVVFEARYAALTALMDTLRQTAPSARAWLRLPFAGGLTRIMSRLVLRLCGIGRHVAIPGCSYGMGNLTDEIHRRHAKRTVEIRGTTGTWRDVIHPVRTLVQAAAGKIVITAIAAPKPSHDHDSALKKKLADVWEALPDPVIRAGLLPYRDELITEAVLTELLANEAAELLAMTRVSSVILNALHWGADVALAEAAGRHGLHRFLVSHGSHTPGESLAAATEQRALAEGQLVSSLADTAIIQSPYSAALASEIMPEMRRSCSLPSMWGYKPIQTEGLNPPYRRVLHAGTYKNLVGLRPWIYETSNEFANGLVDLVHAVEGLKNTHLVIRFRPMLECDVEALKQLLPKSACFEIKTDGSFLDDLANTDLLVSYASTTIEEALNIRCPVLLWGGSARYRHVPARTTPPMQGSRSATYTANDADHLGTMLSNILDYHAGKPLTESELKGHVWPKGTADIGDLADTVARANFRS
ncbi:MAG: hypothetical protein CBB68_06810 [Rhodospirillaceae bacterium TMED8]|nr:hypothetical protein [Magnetovibrio sp.]MAH85448.1 hypothetical protein [Magnetovibrio sp.]OUT47952.1 MAG: hypothetical protein CBB68_14585 [Rhodospirillaceae bacterium TMED8]OUT51326.1 MAG: hypothetical protein CBB68_06810 [Rhodospirillaceae bacterium TMED8]